MAIALLLLAVVGGLEKVFAPKGRRGKSQRLRFGGQ
jgi:hypothetical protein